jgi:hypothetical protein
MCSWPVRMHHTSADRHCTPTAAPSSTVNHLATQSS